MKLTCNACPGPAVDLGPLYILCPIAPGFKTLRGSVCAYSLDNLRDMRTVARARVRTLNRLIEVLRRMAGGAESEYSGPAAMVCADCVERGAADDVDLYDRAGARCHHDGQTRPAYTRCELTTATCDNPDTPPVPCINMQRGCGTCKHFYALTDDPDDPDSSPDCRDNEGERRIRGRSRFDCWEAREINGCPTCKHSRILSSDPEPDNPAYPDRRCCRPDGACRTPRMSYWEARE